MKGMIEMFNNEMKKIEVIEREMKKMKRNTRIEEENEKWNNNEISMKNET